MGEIREMLKLISSRYSHLEERVLHLEKAFNILFEKEKKKEEEKNVGNKD